MSHPLRVRFGSVLLPSGTAHGSFVLDTGDDWIRIRGHLSAGGNAWVLSARASLHRRQLTVWVSATQAESGEVRSVEDHGYEAYLEALKPGRYEVRVVHRFVSPALDSGFHSWPVYGEVIHVGVLAAAPRMGMGSLLAILTCVLPG